MKLAMDWLEFLCCVNAVADPGEGPWGGHPVVILRLGSPPPRITIGGGGGGGLDPALVSGTCRAS